MPRSFELQLQLSVGKKTAALSCRPHPALTMGQLALTDVSEAHQNTVSGSGSERTRGGVSKLPSLAAGRACSRRR